MVAQLKKNSSGTGAGVNPQEATIPEDYSAEQEEPDSPTSSNSKDQGQENGHAVTPSPTATTTTTKKKKQRKKKRKKKARQARSNTNNNKGALNTIAASETPGQQHNKSAPQLTLKKRRKKRNRTVRVATVESNDSSIKKDDEQQQQQPPPTIPLPMNQYKTVLIRRAIRKCGDSSLPGSPQHATQHDGLLVEEKDDHDVLEEYGDISLGMKLSVVAGKLIVQKLTALSDGRASPAQMVGVVQRGDVVLSINNFSLVHLPIDLLMERLKPMSTPDTATGAYQRILYLRLAVGEGLDLLRKYEAAEARKASVPEEAASEVFSLFPMVDQLSGMPLFESHTIYASPSAPPGAHQHQSQSQRDHQYQEEKKQTEEAPSSPDKDGEAAGQKESTTRTQQHPHVSTLQDEKALDEIISSNVAYWRAVDRDKFTSDFFAWNDKYSELMRPTASLPVMNDEKRTDDMAWMTKSEILALGRKALLGAATLSRTMESLDRGKDMRSFRSWNSSISLRSGASTRRRFVLDAVSLPVTMRSAVTGGQEGGSLATAGSERSERSEMADVDGDALLLRLAAHDEIWRSQVIEALEEARDQLDNDSSEGSEDEGDDVTANDGIDSAMSKEFGAFLFGEAMAKIVTKKKKSKALPSEEITAVLFDLSTNLASTMPDEVDVGGGNANDLLKSSLVPFVGRKNQEAGSSVILATRFVLDEALVVWLETFRPLPWESRRVLWPRVKHSPSGASRSPSMFSDTDSLTLDSGQLSPSSVYSTPTSDTRTQSKDLRQQIEDQELDAETRAETCFLVTYYFTQRLLPKCTLGLTSDALDGVDTLLSGEAGALVEFVKKYGAYMKLHTCLAYAAALKCCDVINELLELAEHDMRHREVIKLFSRRNALILYEPTMLSAIVKCLPIIRKESNAGRRQALVDICVSAYPDLCPWQVKQALLEHREDAASGSITKSAKQDLNDLYYYYLSNVLHAQDGHDAARHDAGLVEEWCILSLDASKLGSKTEASTRRNNFLSVASRNSSDHLGYHRDLVVLLKLSMASHEYDLALELAGEIADNHRLTQNSSIVTLLLQYLREISRHALDQRGEDMQSTALSTLKRVIRLLHHMSHPSPRAEQQHISVSDELHALLEYKESCCGAAGKGLSRENLDLIHFLAKEAPPSDFLRAFSMWTDTHDELSDTVHVLQSVLRKGARRALNTELSGSLLRLRRARQGMNSCYKEVEIVEVPEQTIWSLMSKGLVAVDK